MTSAGGVPMGSLALKSVAALSSLAVSVRSDGGFWYRPARLGRVLRWRHAGLTERLHAAMAVTSQGMQRVAVVFGLVLLRTCGSGCCAHRCWSPTETQAGVVG
jgi:hypothetical protein